MPTFIARLPQEHQAAAFENCWRKDWQDKEAHLLPAKHLSAWIQANLYLNLAEAPFDREDTTPKPHSRSLRDLPTAQRVQYKSVCRCARPTNALDAPCFQAKVTAHIDREIRSAASACQYRDGMEGTQGAASRSPPEDTRYRELNVPDNPDADPPCSHTRAAIITFGRQAGRTG